MNPFKAGDVVCLRGYDHPYLVIGVTHSFVLLLLQHGTSAPGCVRLYDYGHYTRHEKYE